MPGKTFQFLLTFVLGNCLGIFPAFIIAQTKPSFFELKNRAIDSAVTKNEKAVIRLDIFSRDDRAPKVGTGVVVSPDGLVLTSTFFVNYPKTQIVANINSCLLYTSPSPRDATLSRMPSSA